MYRTGVGVAEGFDVGLDEEASDAGLTKLIANRNFELSPLGLHQRRCRRKTSRRVVTG